MFCPHMILTLFKLTNLYVWVWDDRVCFSIQYFNTQHFYLPEKGWSNRESETSTSIFIRDHVEKKLKQLSLVKKKGFWWTEQNLGGLISFIYSHQTTGRCQLTLNHITLCKMRSCTNRAHTCIHLLMHHRGKRDKMQ